MIKDKEQNDFTCATANALNIFGDRWSLLIIRNYIFAECREYGEFIEKIHEGISTSILAERLKWLCDNGIFSKHPHPTNKKKFYYELTEKGFDLIVVIMELAKWSWKYYPDAYSPPQVKANFKKDPASFKKEWEKRVKESTRRYLEEAEGR